MNENFQLTTSLARLQDAVMPLNLLQLPEEILLHILSFVNYHTISELRRVNQTFNKMCQHILTKAFSKVDCFHGSIQRRVKSQLPRRESERRTHSLARHMDILSAVETRLSLLNMTYIKYIDIGLCSFIPGKVLDELFRILRVLQENPEPPRAHEFLQELRDISSMAMEHFEERIVPLIKQKIPSMGVQLPFTDSPSGSRTFREFSLPAVSPRQDVVKLQHQVQSQGMSLQTYRKEMADIRQRLTEQKKRLIEQEKKNCEQGRIIAEQNSRLQEQEKKIGDFGRKILEYDQKFSDIFAELSKSGSVSSTPDNAHTTKWESTNRKTETKNTSSGECTESRSRRSRSRKRSIQTRDAQNSHKQAVAKRRKT